VLQHMNRVIHSARRPTSLLHIFARIPRAPDYLSRSESMPSLLASGQAFPYSVLSFRVGN